MKIIKDFINETIIEDYLVEFQSVYDDNLLLQYLDKKMKKWTYDE